ncbi:hypothetical protein NDU88_000546 [Pleurodeles waltl]|uniref:Uncharacterized protein n=1 Tax=Pleurodeles waltl TaxID=8319 RepID=A0AAV7R8F9_PLEWA|nr:hypothetical protein NDU88_000546 [Pleurodeles waltl]
MMCCADRLPCELALGALVPRPGSRFWYQSLTLRDPWRGFPRAKGDMLHLTEFVTRPSLKAYGSFINMPLIKYCKSEHKGLEVEILPPARSGQDGHRFCALFSLRRCEALCVPQYTRLLWDRISTVAIQTESDM